ncbi:hypothetical protein ISW69_17375 [Escherichia coli]|uniref:hypothetical protein n=1 Tax=Escherichia coli TaxID=562 RepID=UPI001889AB6E|nr:hypothetical protein [Escherichia coli]MBF1831620.1 hypothetical protein [Escherichia coli]
MKIVKAEVFVTCPGRNFVTLKITTEDGITGLGDATLNGRELSVASYLQDHLCPQLTGHSIDEALDDYARHQELGFKAIRVQCGIPGMKTTYGMSKGKGLAYEPATKGQWPEEQLWSTEKYLDFMPKLFDAVRNKLEVFPHNWTFDNGYMHPGDKPGLGIEFDEKLAAKYPYEPAYLPVARLEDGTLWNW